MFLVSFSGFQAHWAHELFSLLDIDVALLDITG